MSPSAKKFGDPALKKHFKSEQFQGETWKKLNMEKFLLSNLSWTVSGRIFLKNKPQVEKFQGELFLKSF